MDGRRILFGLVSGSLLASNHMKKMKGKNKVPFLSFAIFSMLFILYYFSFLFFYLLI